MKDALLYVGLTQAIFTIFIVLFTSNKKVLDRILIAYLGVIALRFYMQIVDIDNVDSANVNLSMIWVPLSLGPFLYLYTCYLIIGENRFNTKHYLHFIPLIIGVFVHVVFFRDTLSFNEVVFFDKDNFLWIRILYAISFIGSVIIYMTLTLLLITEFNNKVKSKDVVVYDNRMFKWLIFNVSLISLTFLIYFFVGLINALNFEQIFDLDYLSRIGTVLFTFSLSYYAINKSREKSDSVPGGESLNILKQDQKIRFTQERAQYLEKELKDRMEIEKLYLNQELTLAELASRLNISKYDLSSLLNDFIGKNFFTYVNEYRLNHTIEKLKSKDNDHLTIIAIAYESGFNSKSTFNTLFKEHTGLTPSAYKENIS